MMSNGWGRLLARGLAASTKSPVQAHLFRSAISKTYTPALTSLLARALATKTTSTTKKKVPGKKATTVKKTTVTTKKKATTAPKKKPATAVKKAPAKKPAAKKRGVAVKKPLRRKKPVVKKKPVKKKKAVAKKPVNKITEARKTVLKPPPRACTSYTIFFTESLDRKPGAPSVTVQAKTIGGAWKTLSEAEKATYKTRADAKKVELARAYDLWVSKFTPEQIRQSNVKASALSLDSKKKGARSHSLKIKDERLVKHPSSAYMYFIKEAYQRPDMNGNATSRVKSLVAEYKALTDAQKKKYVDLAAADKVRYDQEKKTVYG